uniref:Uncharacterized protein n=1 Tax=Oryza barthii TaxID=65489 RepID=A0A0D3FL81_9ORYZ
MASSTVTVVCKEGRGGGGGEAAAEEEARQHGRIELGGAADCWLELREPPLPELRPKRVVPLIQGGREHQVLPRSTNFQNMYRGLYTYFIISLPMCCVFHAATTISASFSPSPRPAAASGKAGMRERSSVATAGSFARPPVAAGKEVDPAKRQILQRGRGEEEAQIHGARGVESCLGIRTSSYGSHGAAQFLPPWCHSVREQQSLRVISPPRVVVVHPRKLPMRHFLLMASTSISRIRS